jgi:protein O-GlcNAc transferase
LSQLNGLLQGDARDARAWFLAGACHDRLGTLGRAAQAFRQSIVHAPDNPEHHLALISVLHKAGDLKQALDVAEHALTCFPTNSRLAFAAGVVLEDLAIPEEALARYERAISISPVCEDAHHNRGVLLSRLHRFQEAAENQRRYLRAFPNRMRALEVLVDVLFAQGNFEEALLSIQRLLDASPNDTKALVRKGAALASLHRYADATAAFEQARMRNEGAVIDFIHRIAPGMPLSTMTSPENLYLWQGWLGLARCDWRSWDAYVSELRSLPSKAGAAIAPAVSFVSFHLPLSGSVRHSIARRVASDIESRISPLPQMAQPSNRGGKLRVGILSPDLREHLNAYLLLPLFELVDRSRISLYAYSLTRDDGSEIRGRIAASSDAFRELHTMSDVEAATSIRNDDIDILLDVAGHTIGGRFAITAQRPARLQVLYLGFPGSLGSKRVDHVIVDRIVGSDPGEWTESPVFVPDTYYLYDFRQAPPQAVVARDHYGLCDDGFVYCAFHKAEKISPDVFALWMQILTKVPSSVLWLLSLSDAARRNLRQAADRHDVDPARLVFAPYDSRDRYLARQRLGDLMLDTLHHSAMTTACDAMAAGLPVLTIRGDAMSSRAGESLARAAGVPEMVVRDKDAYVERAIFLARNPDVLQRLRQKLLARTGPLFDTVGRVRELESAFLEIWRRYELRH